MISRRHVLQAGAAVAVPILSSLLAANAHATEFPRKPVKLVVPQASGSGADTMPRFYGEILAGILGQPVVVENKPGASGIIAAQYARNAEADGHTLFVGVSSTMVLLPLVQNNLPYDPKDFRPVYGLSMSPAAFYVRANSPYKTLDDLRREKKGVSIASYAVVYEVIAKWFSDVSGVKSVYVPYKGGGAVTTDVLGGQVDVGLGDFSALAPLIQAGSIRVLGVTGSEREAKFPEIPTMQEQGLKDLVSYNWAALYAPARTPDAVVNRLVKAFEEAVATPKAREFQSQNSWRTVPGGPKRLAEMQASDTRRMKALVERLNFKVQ